MLRTSWWRNQIQHSLCPLIFAGGVSEGEHPIASDRVFLEGKSAIFTGFTIMSSNQSFYYKTTTHLEGGDVVANP